MKTIKELQNEVSSWSARFGPMDKRTRWTAIGILEELGEFVHAQLKSEDGHRGGSQEHWDKEKQDAIADSIVFLLDHCACVGWESDELVDAYYGEAVIEPRALQISTFADIQRLARSNRHHIDWCFLNHLMNIATSKCTDTVRFLNDTDVAEMLMNWGRYCDEHGWDLQEIFERVWGHVRTRDQEKRKIDG